MKQDITVRRFRGERLFRASSRGQRLLNVGCQELERHLRAELAERADAYLDIASADYVERHCSDYKPSRPKLVLADSSWAPVPASRPQSDTNQQVGGVDEPDLIEVDQQRFYAISGDQVVILDTTDPGKPRQLGSLQIEGAARGLFAEGSRLVVLSSLGPPNPKRNCGMQCWQRGERSPARLAVFDVSDPGKPALLRRLELSGHWLGARKIGSTVHALVQEELGVRPQFSYSLPLDQHPATPGAAWASFEALRKENRKLVEAVDVSTLLPKADDTLAQVKHRISECNATLNTTPGSDFTSILSFDLTEQRPARRTLVRARAGVFYANSGRLYLTDPLAQGTLIHQLALESGGSRYVAGGTLGGRVPSQFALDEHESFLRVATTEGQSNGLQVLHAQGEELLRVGGVGFGRSEWLRAMRFAGDRGYAVTFPARGRRVDPLFTFDLSDPQRPRVLGELEVPGFSTYVHPLDKGRLLTVGYDADQRSGDVRGLVVQVFDVSRPLHPRTVDRRQIGSAGTSSAALMDHLAFTYFAPKNLLLLPLTVCERRAARPEATFSGLMLLGLGPTGHLSQRGRVSHGDLVERNCSVDWTQGESAVERTALLGDFVYAVGDRTLTVIALSAPYRARTTLPLR